MLRLLLSYVGISRGIIAAWAVVLGLDYVYAGWSTFLTALFWLSIGYYHGRSPERERCEAESGRH